MGSDVAALSMAMTLDLIVGARQDESGADGAPSNTGAVYGFVSDGETWFDADSPSFVVGSALSGDRFGITVSGYTDVNGDGLNEVLAVAGRNQDFGGNLSRPFWFPASMVPTPLGARDRFGAPFWFGSLCLLI